MLLVSDRYVVRTLRCRGPLLHLCLSVRLSVCLWRYVLSLWRKYHD